jgi:c-di-GMP-binding flagellar brake protein YcgR
MEERRQFPRYPAPKSVYGRVRSIIPARVVDISLGGIQLELTSSLRPGTTCDVTIPTMAGPLQVKAAVRRCRARSVHSDEGTRLLYCAGLEFEGLDDLDRRALISGLYGVGSTTLELGGVDIGFMREHSA